MQPFLTMPLSTHPALLTVTQTSGVLAYLRGALTQLLTGPASFGHFPRNVTPSESPSLICICCGPTSPHLLCLLRVTLSTSSLPRAAYEDAAMLGIVHLYVTEGTHPVCTPVDRHQA